MYTSFTTVFLHIVIVFFFNHMYAYKTICPQFQVVREVSA